MPRPKSTKTKRSLAQKGHLSSVVSERSGQVSAVASGQATPVKISEPNPEALYDALNAANNVLTQKNAQLHNSIRVEWRKNQRAASRKLELQKQIKLLRSVELPTAKGDAAQAIKCLEKTKSENDCLDHQLSQLFERCTLEATQSKEKHSVLNAQLAASTRQIRNLKKSVSRMPGIKVKTFKCAKDYANKENRTYKLLHKGVYSPQARELARTLVSAGCSREYVDNVIRAVCKNAGVTVQGKMSRRTVSRAILEGGVAAKIQIGHELAQADGR